MNKLLRNRWSRLTLALCLSVAVLSTAALAVDETTSGGSTAISLKVMP